MKKLFYMLMLFISVRGFAQFPVNTDDSLALVDFYYHTSGLPWSVLDPVSEWTGVSLQQDGHETRVIGITLMNMGLSGSIAALGNLPKLQTLVLRNNAFSGDLPAELSGLSDLGTLVLANNQF
ncbi:MAG TPA: hypothetical protein PLA68_08535, partial [Panacibacter sp.]|nr:hypothetical protein [Panacibacter sp.]